MGLGVGPGQELMHPSRVHDIEALIDAQTDPKSRGAVMLLFRLIQDLERRLDNA